MAVLHPAETYISRGVVNPPLSRFTDDANACASDAYCGAPTTGRVVGRADGGTLGISGEVTAESGTVLVKERRGEESQRRGEERR